MTLIEDEFEDTLAIEQLRAWEISCVLRVQTDREDLYFKALPRSYAREPQLAQFLADRHPDFVPGVVARRAVDVQFRPRLWSVARGRQRRTSLAAVPTTPRHAQALAAAFDLG